MLKNAKTEYFNEAEEIATYTSIETLATTVGDTETAKLARSIRREERRMANFLERQIPALTKSVAQEEIPAAERRGTRSRRGTASRRSTASRRGSQARATQRQLVALLGRVQPQEVACLTPWTVTRRPAATRPMRSASIAASRSSRRARVALPGGAGPVRVPARGPVQPAQDRNALLSGRSSISPRSCAPPGPRSVPIAPTVTTESRSGARTRSTSWSGRTGSRSWGASSWRRP